MSHTVPTQHPAVVLRSSYQHLQALLAIGTIVIVSLTVAVVVLAINNGRSTTVSQANRATSSVNRSNPSAELGAKLDHRGVTPAAPATSSAVQASRPNVVQPNPDEQGAGTAAPATSSAVQASRPNVVQPNPDEQGLPASPPRLGSNSSYFYPGHF